MDWRYFLLIACCFSDVNCDTKTKAPTWKPPAPKENTPEIECPDDESQPFCVGNWEVSCKDGEPEEMVDCLKTDEVCAPYIGCSHCVPGKITCGESNDVIQCRKDGSAFDEIDQCNAAADEHCDIMRGGCANLCQTAKDSKSYIGCEYYAVPTINSELRAAFSELELSNPFDFAVVIANPQAVNAEIVIERDGSIVYNETVEPGEMATFILDWIPLLFTGVLEEDDYEYETNARSVIVKEGAYRITSSVPVTAYQFNPLRFQEEIEGQDFYSHTNDASLLLPTYALTGNYVAVSRPTRLVVSKISSTSPNCGKSEDFPCYEETTSSSPGFLAIIGVEDGPTDVQITTSSYVVGDALGNIPDAEPGDTFSVDLERGEVLQLLSATPSHCPEDSYVDEISNCSTNLADPDPCSTVKYTYCDVTADYDLTGTTIQASGKVAVISGHNCAFVPHDRWACDHLEESMFPTESWGREIFVALSEPIREEPNIIRVLSNSDNNEITFTPDVYETVSVDSGEYIEFIADRDFRVRGTDAILVAQFLVGQDYDGFRSSGLRSEGDPGMSLGIPKEQWRERYTFLAPETFPDNTVIVIANQDQAIVLDGQLITGFQKIEGSTMSAARVAIESGQHVIEAASTFGIVVYGYALYTSYIYPGGLDLRVINII